MKKTLLAALVALSAASAAHAGKVTSTLPVDKDFATYELIWKPRGKTLIRWDVINDGGYVAVCGGYSATGGSYAYKASGDSLGTMGVKLNGEVLIKNLRYFANFKSNNQASGHLGEAANCVRTGTPVPKGKISVEMFSTKSSFRY
ncbi:hypothetical protein [Celeribacter ethanolicus]|uniref:Uncharacterized protein n=1 Tax=Celeribacter ethanolicus TaxID=1758178 RepID=A0A291GFI3_9RHOB|nr:hypothetical protein [Celeribacter ethanolicus]ATG49303.1 hypothetical protein CEW89_18000 [Celeribacter ethanolicus]TNE67433.1 MAG: hypothetical protein EP336_07855 [Paracoccaceae bacterium]